MRFQNSPWGKPQDERVLCVIDGHAITLVSTPSHGGAHVPDALLYRIPPVIQLRAQRWSGSRNWYEEDCCLMDVARAFPEAGLS